MPQPGELEIARTLPQGTIKGLRRQRLIGYYPFGLIKKIIPEGLRTSAHFNLGRILVNQEKIWEAIVHFRQTLTPEDDETPRCTYALAAALARVGIWEEALKYMVEAQEKARARGQLALLEAIERDLRSLERDGNR